MAGKPTFDSIRCGDVLPEVRQQISQEDIWHYAAASLDMNPVHCAPEWCKTAQVFGIPETVQHGAQTQSLLCKVITNWGIPFKVANSYFFRSASSFAVET